MSLQIFLEHYGYLAILVGTFFEGETLLLLGAYAAHRGYLSLPAVMAAAFAGALASDHLYFHLGRRHGAGFLGRHPRMDDKVQRVLRRVGQHGTPLVLAMRFLWGMRVALPLAVGLSGMRPVRFLLLDTISAALWSCCIGLVGFGASRLLSQWIEDLHRHEHWLFAALGLLALAAVLWRWRPQRGTSAALS